MKRSFALAALIIAAVVTAGTPAHAKRILPLIMKGVVQDNSYEVYMTWYSTFNSEHESCLQISLNDMSCVPPEGVDEYISSSAGTLGCMSPDAPCTAGDGPIMPTMYGP